MEKILEKKGFICDMDGVIYHGNKILDGVAEFVNWMIENNKKFVFIPYKQPRKNTARAQHEAGAHGPFRFRRPFLYKRNGYL